MKQLKQILVGGLALLILLSLAACGQNQTQETETKQTDGPSEVLQGVYNELIKPESGYSQTKESYKEFYTEAEYTEELDEQGFRLAVENIPDGSGVWFFADEGNAITATLGADDFSGMLYVLDVVEAVASYYGQDPDLARAYVNGLGAFGINNDEFSMTENADGTTTYRIGTAGAWKMSELDQMVLDETVMGGYDPLGEDYVSRAASVGKMRMAADGSVDDLTMYFMEYGELDDIAYQSIVNMVKLFQPTGWEEFAAEYTSLSDAETDIYTVNLSPDDETVTERLGERDSRFSYAVVKFGSAEEYEETAYVPAAELFADLYFRTVGGYHADTAGASLIEAQAACDALAFAVYNRLCDVDTDTLRANMLESWQSLTDEERASFDANFSGIDALVKGCFEDWDANRSRFEDVENGVDTMEAAMSLDMAAESWDTLSANTWTLGNTEG